jgi:cellobiose-specific phosphotransferase system component IIA
VTDDFSAAASRLVEAARSARNGDCETAKIHIAQALELIHCHPSVHSASQATVRGGLAKWQARRLMEHIDAHLATKIHLDELALLFVSAPGISAGYSNALSALRHMLSSRGAASSWRNGSC